jgi:small subunit ribosomal protein S16
MVRIRLLRVGAIRQPSYRIVVADQRSPRDGRFIEIIGNYNPRTEPNTVVVDRERALFWLGRGAQPSEAVARLLEQTSVMAIQRGETTLEEVMSKESAQA